MKKEKTEIVDKKVGNEYKRTRGNLTAKERTRWKILVIFFAVLAALNAGYYVLELVLQETGQTFLFFGKPNFYQEHFLLPISILSIALITMCISYVNKYSSYKNDSKNDGIMMLIGTLLIFVALISFVSSFM